MLTTEIHFDTRLYLQSGQKTGEVALYKQSNYPGSESKLIGNFIEDKAGKLMFVIADGESIRLMASAPPVEIKVADDIPF